MWVDDIVSYISEILNDNNVLPLEDILSEISQAPVKTRRTLTRRLRNLEQLENFLQIQEDHFIVENGKVAEYDPDLATGRERAAEYFEEELNHYDEPPNYLNFRGHLGQAEDDVIHFFNTFYPGEEFRNFLLSHPDVFFVFEDDTVSLINYLNSESVDYFVDCLEEREGLRFKNLRGHLGQAQPHVIEFINTQYPGDSFLDFLEKNSDVFFVLPDDTVYLIIYLNCISVEHFEDCLENIREGLYFMSLRRHLRQASDQVIEFINTRYPGKSFLRFLENNSDVFIVFDDATVFLIENESVNFFKECLRPREGLDYMHLRRYLRYAPNHVTEFINTEYPGESFMDFLEINSDVFYIYDGVYVYLISKDDD